MMTKDAKAKTKVELNNFERNDCRQTFCCFMKNDDTLFRSYFYFCVRLAYFLIFGIVVVGFFFSFEWTEAHNIADERFWCLDISFRIHSSLVAVLTLIRNKNELLSAAAEASSSFELWSGAIQSPFMHAHIYSWLNSNNWF